tara:strand:+ start:384 stop:1358 length:975 start_codon:yes stop_codon:yes gene_type:complete
MKRTMIVDSTNIYFRSYLVDPSLSLNGSPIGGYKGFIKSLQKLCRIIKPDEIVLIWDGEGGSQKRRQINKDYKAGRKPLRFNRREVQMTEKETEENMIWQRVQLSQMLNCMPVVNLMIDKIEADDVIAYIARHPKYAESQKVLVSSDKDFFQLCDDKTVIYRPAPSKGSPPVVVTEKTLLDEYQIHPRNFALARAIDGDKSDNLPGVRGIGLSTISKRFPFFKENRDILFEDLYEACENEEKPIKAHTGILENKTLIEENYSIMQLYSPTMSVQAKQKIDYTIQEFKPEFNKTEVLKLMSKDGFGELNATELFSNFRHIVTNKK